MKHYFIYKITNLKNNKIYIGKHITNNLNDGYMGSGLLIKKAIEKYGITNFKKEIIKHCSNEDELNKAEAEIVNEDFCKRKDTYNINTGGTGGWYYINSHNLQGTWLGRKHTEYTKQKMRNTFQSHTHQQGIKNSQYGHIWVYNEELMINKSIKREEYEIYEKNGYKKGRKMSFKF